MTSKKLLLLIFLTVLVFVGLVSYGDWQQIGAHLARFPVAYLVASLALAALNYLLRFFRWAYYLHILKIRVPLGANSLVFLSGLAMSITPGKLGELLKSYLLRDRAGVPVSASAPAVIMERLTDVVAVVLLGLTGLALLPLPVLSVLAGLLFLCGIAVAVIASRRSDRLLRLPVLRRWANSLHASRDSLRLLAAPRSLAVAVALGLAAWLSEGAALWVILQGLDANIPMLRALPIYAGATLVGAISTLPGGLVGTEGSMVALLQQSGVARDAASAGTLLVRLVTLWFAVLVGLAALAALNRLRRAQVSPSPAGEPDSSILQTPP